MNTLTVAMGEEREIRHITVEPPNKGHFVTIPFVPCREVVPSQRFTFFLYNSPYNIIGLILLSYDYLINNVIATAEI